MYKPLQMMHFSEIYWKYWTKPEKSLEKFSIVNIIFI